jgi:hypothetical protein
LLVTGHGFVRRDGVDLIDPHLQHAAALAQRIRFKRRATAIA